MVADALSARSTTGGCRGSPLLRNSLAVPQSDRPARWPILTPEAVVKKLAVLHGHYDDFGRPCETVLRTGAFCPQLPCPGESVSCSDGMQLVALGSGLDDHVSLFPHDLCALDHTSLGCLDRRVRSCSAIGLLRNERTARDAGLTPSRYVEVRRRFQREHPGRLIFLQERQLTTR
jgi:hypothetical protein